MQNSQIHISEMDPLDRKAIEACGRVVDETSSSPELIAFHGSAQLRQRATTLYDTVMKLSVGDDRYYISIDPRKRLTRDLEAFLARFEFERSQYPIVNLGFDLNTEAKSEVGARSEAVIDLALAEHRKISANLTWVHSPHYWHNDGIEVAVKVEPDREHPLQITVSEFLNWRMFDSSAHYIGIRSALNTICRVEQLEFSRHQTGFWEMRLRTEWTARNKFSPLLNLILNKIIESPRIVKKDQ